MKAPRKNHQERDFDKKKPLQPKETPVADAFRKVVFFGIIGGILWFCYSYFYMGLQVDLTIREIYGFEQSVRVLTKPNRPFTDAANMGFLHFSGHVDDDMYDEQSKMGKNRFGGAIVIAPTMGGTMFTIEVAGIPPYVCRRMLKEDWGTTLTLDSIRVGGRIFTWEDGLPIVSGSADDYCESRNVKFTFK